MHPVTTPAKQAYFEQVWHFVRKVPAGKVVTYGQIAQSLPEPDDTFADEHYASAAQLVGSAMTACPEDVPWHRVINSQGRVSNRPDSDQQRLLLEAEGVHFFQGRLSLDDYQWHGEDRSDKPEQQRLF